MSLYKIRDQILPFCQKTRFFILQLNSFFIFIFVCFLLGALLYLLILLKFFKVQQQPDSKYSLKVLNISLKPIPTTCLCLSNTWRFQITKMFNIGYLQQLHLLASCVTIHHGTTPSTTFRQYTSAYLFSDLLSNYPSSMRCPTKQRLLTHCTNYISLCHIDLHLMACFQQPVSNSYYSLDYISPFLSPKHFKQL